MAADSNDLSGQLNGVHVGVEVASDEKDSESRTSSKSEVDSVVDRSLCQPSFQADLIGVESGQLIAVKFFNRLDSYDHYRDEWVTKDTEFCGHVLWERQGDVMMTFNDETKDIWINSDPWGLSKFNLSTGNASNVNLHDEDPLPFMSYPGMVVVGDILHLVESYQLHHVMFNTRTRTMEQVRHMYRDIEGLTADFHTDKLIYSKATNQLYFFGSGSHYHDVMYDGNVIFAYCLQNQKWTFLQPTNLNNINMSFCESSIVSSVDGRHVFALRGLLNPDKREAHSNEIAVFDVENNMLRRSSLKLPAKDENCENTAVIVRDRSMESLLCSGYIRNLFKSPDFKKSPQMYVPMVLVQYIGQWICIEFIHVIPLLRRNTHVGEHFRVGVREIMESLR